MCNSEWRLVIPPRNHLTIAGMIERFNDRQHRRNIVTPPQNIDGELVIVFTAPDEATAENRGRYLFCDLAMWPNNSSAIGAYRVEACEPTWTFVGHWDHDKIVVEYVLPGVVEDQRKDTGFWEQGLWAASGSGPTQEIAQQQVLAEYEK